MGSRTGRERMLPLMTATVVVLGVFFFGASMWQLWALNDAIADAPGLTNAEIAPLLQDLAGASTQAEQVAAQRALLTSLELDVTNRRHYMTGVFVRTNAWIKYLGFVTGMILAVTGAVFIVGRLRAPETEIEAEVASVRYQVRSASPGIILAVLGVALMVSTIAIRHGVSFNDRAVYVSEDSLVSGESADADDSNGLLP